jgi:hypothetical protein
MGIALLGKLHVLVRFISGHELMLRSAGQVKTSRLAPCLLGGYRVMHCMMIHFGWSLGLGDSIGMPSILYSY